MPRTRSQVSVSSKHFVDYCEKSKMQSSNRNGCSTNNYTSTKSNGISNDTISSNGISSANNNYATPLSNGKSKHIVNGIHATYENLEADKSIIIAYVLWLFGGLFGLHHIYLRRDRHAFVWWCTLGSIFK